MRDYQDQKADVILKYNAEEARNLKAYGELPDHGKLRKDNVTLLPPANDVWGKVIISQAFVCPQGGGMADTPPRQTPSRADTRPPSPRLTAPPTEMATEAGGTHPTGMHSC